tara:strand:- start:388 stop:981 length:594 start_codon:yes stop_codon:yes gene_type:complete
MLKKIKVYGRLRKFIGESVLEADVNSPLEAISFLHCNFKGLEKHMANQHYVINCGNLKITEDLLNLKTESDIQIIPLAHGNFLPILLGAGALFGASAITAGSFLGSTLLVNALTAVGTSMLIEGVTQLVAPQQNMNSAASNMDQTDPAALASNYSFTGLTNVSRAGVPVNLAYGEILVGSITISNGVDTVQVEGSNE